MTELTERFTQAVDYARRAHAGQYRKGTRIPYFYHLMGVSSLVLEHGGDEDQAIGGLLHDVVEDCGEEHAEHIRTQFGERVVRIVLACTDGTRESKAEEHSGLSAFERWKRRKLAYLAHLEHVDEDALLVSACDKLHNACAIVSDLEDPAVGAAVFERFTGRREGTLAYYQSLLGTFERFGSPVHPALSRSIATMHAFNGGQRRRCLSEI